MSRKKSENRIAATVVNGVEASSEPVKMEREPRDFGKYLGLAAQIAESTIYCGNWKFKNAEKHFPTEPLLRTVDKFFPQAKGGPLLVDQPTSKRDVENCERKASAIRSEGLRYVYLTEEMTIDEAMDQLTGGLH